MWKHDAIEHFGNARELAAFLHIHPSAVSMWGLLVPRARGWELEARTQGALRMNTDLYALQPAELERLFAVTHKRAVTVPCT